MKVRVFHAGIFTLAVSAFVGGCASEAGREDTTQQQKAEGAAGSIEACVIRHKPADAPTQEGWIVVYERIDGAWREAGVHTNTDQASDAATLRIDFSKPGSYRLVKHQKMQTRDRAGYGIETNEELELTVKENEPYVARHFCGAPEPQVPAEVTMPDGNWDQFDAPGGVDDSTTKANLIVCTPEAGKGWTHVYRAVGEAADGSLVFGPPLSPKGYVAASANHQMKIDAIDVDYRFSVGERGHPMRAVSYELDETGNPVITSDAIIEAWPVSTLADNGPYLCPEDKPTALD